MKAKHLTYLAVVQSLASQSRQQLELLPHWGEQGRALEEVVKGVLRLLLPRRFSLGAGFLINAKGELSRQQDIVIYDHVFNSPILSEFGASIYPVECVYATIEVKTTLTVPNLRDTLESIQRLRSIGRQRSYLVPNESTGTTNVVTYELPPRSYVIAAAKKGFGRSLPEMRKKVGNLCDETDSHIHGLCVLATDWFMLRKPYKQPAEIKGVLGHALARLYQAILEHSVSYPMFPANIGQYLSDGKSE